MNATNKNKFNYNTIVLILLAFFVKLGVCIYLFHSKVHPLAITHYYAFNCGDTFSYFDSIDHLIEKGTYKPFYRMPGIGAPYYLLRLFFSKYTAINLFTLFQIAYDSVACYLLARIALLLTNNKVFFGIVYVLSIINTYNAIYDISLLSESLCTSSLIVSLYFFYRAVEDKDGYKFVLLCGLFTAWTIFCRSIFLPVLILYILLFLYYTGLKDKWKLTKLVAVFIFPMVVLDTAWIIAGYQHTGKIYPLQHSSANLSADKTEAYEFEGWRIGIINYVQAFGGDLVWWNPDAEIRWFIQKHRMKGKVKKLPPYAYTKYITGDSLLLLRKNIAIIQDSSFSPSVRDSVEKCTIQLAERYTNQFKNEKPFHYQILSRLIILKKFIFHQPTYNLYYQDFGELSIMNKVIKISCFLLYYIYVFGFLLSFFLIFLDKRIKLFIPVVMMALYGLLIYPFLRFCEYRYIAPVVPLMLLMSAYSIVSVYERIKAYSTRSGT